MIGKDEFKKLIMNKIKYTRRVNTLCNELNNNLYESYFCSYTEDLFKKVLNFYFIPEQIVWIEYYLYDNPEDCCYIDKVKYPLTSIDDLWNLINLPEINTKHIKNTLINDK